MSRIFVFSNSGTQRLPSAYQEVEYIQSSGTQYIDTGVVGTNKTAVWTTTAENLSSATNTALISNGYASTVRNCYGTFIISRTWSTLNAGSVTATGKQNIVSTTIINTSGNTSTTIVVDGVESSTASRIYDYRHNMGNTTLFASKVDASTMTSGGNFKLYSASCSLDGVLVRNFIPCYRKSDSVAGMFDTQVQLSGLPSGYTELEYIQSTGGIDANSAYINTGYKCNNNTKLSSDIIITQSTKVAGDMATTNAQITCNINVSANYNLRFGNNNIPYKDRLLVNTGEHIITMDKNGCYIDDILDCSFSDQTTWTSTSDLYLFKFNGATTANQAFKMKWFKIYDNNTLVRNFIPAKNSSNVLGMYDTVNGVFYQNAGSGSFTAGPEKGFYTNAGTGTFTVGPNVGVLSLVDVSQRILVTSNN